MKTAQGPGKRPNPQYRDLPTNRRKSAPLHGSASARSGRPRLFSRRLLAKNQSTKSRPARTRADREIRAKHQTYSAALRLRTRESELRGMLQRNYGVREIGPAVSGARRSTAFHVETAEGAVAICNVEGEVHAMDGICSGIPAGCSGKAPCMGEFCVPVSCLGIRLRHGRQ